MQVFKKLITTFIGLCLAITCFSQKIPFDTAKVVLNAKMNLISFEDSKKTREEILNAVNSDIKYELINSELLTSRSLNRRMF